MNKKGRKAFVPTATLLALTLLALASLPLRTSAQTDSIWVIRGHVADRQTHKAIGYVSVTDGKVGTVTNDDGDFTLKLRKPPRRLTFSHMGYTTQYATIGDATGTPLSITMLPAAIRLNEIVIEGGDWKGLVDRAIERIGDNYPKRPNLMRGFYRETVKKKNRFISIAEAVVDLYKGSYSKYTFNDRVAISKGRRLLSMKASDTLAVKLEGGPVIPIDMDLVKNSELLLSHEELDNYHFGAGIPERQDNRSLYAIKISPGVTTDYPLYHGTIYIDKTTLAFVRIDLSLDMTDREKVTRQILRKKPAGLRFTPHELTIRADYETDSAGITRLHYVRNTVHFRCDWKRKVFKSNFTVQAEMVVSDWTEGDDVRPIRGRNTFNSRDRFYDKAQLFDDPDFWGQDNIIEPTESLEKAVVKLRKMFSR